MAAPADMSEADAALLDKIGMSAQKPHGLNRMGANQSSLSELKKVDDRLVAPKVLVQKTKEQLAFYKENPRPISSMPKKDSDEYSDEVYDDGFEEVNNEDAKLE